LILRLSFGAVKKNISWARALKGFDAPQHRCWWIEIDASKAKKFVALPF
jgi:hypothetical protein